MLSANDLVKVYSPVVRALGGVSLDLHAGVIHGLLGANGAGKSSLIKISVVGILAMGMTMLLISANLDLSVGGQVAPIGVVIARVMNAIRIMPALVAAVLVGFVLGLIVTRLRVNSLVATLGSGLAFSGIAFPASGSQPIVLADRGLQMFMSDHGRAGADLDFIAAIVVSAWFLHFTVGGREPSPSAPAPRRRATLASASIASYCLHSSSPTASAPLPP